MTPHIERVLEAARSAPSHNNAQQWRFTVDGDAVAFGLDLDRAFGGDAIMARIALGAAVECACVAAARMGITPRPAPPREGALVELLFADPKRLADPDLSRTRRVTNRRIYDARALDDATLKSLRDATPKRDIAQTHWFGRERVRALAPIIEQAEELLYDPARIETTLAPLRFDVKDKDIVEQGMSIGCLELGTAERTALATLRKPIGEGAAAAARRTLAGRARKQMESASGVCIVTTAGSDPMADVDVGRAVQRAWMVLTQKGMAAHPMMGLFALTHGTAEPDADTIDQRVVPLMQAFRDAFPHVGKEERVAFLLRFGWADAPTCRTGRLPVEASVI